MRLGTVWEIESRNDPQRPKAFGVWQVEFGTVASTSNLNQFTKYSRLQWHLYEEKISGLRLANR